MHKKPCILLNTTRYWNGLLEFLDTCVTAGFIKPENRNLLIVAKDAQEAVQLALNSF
jgi:predicted Rossmann-fold nucleotide-binding protein